MLLHTLFVASARGAETVLNVSAGSADVTAVQRPSRVDEGQISVRMQMTHSCTSVVPPDDTSSLNLLKLAEDEAKN